jgi:hypothetical protein
VVEIKASQAGPFGVGTELFLDDNGLRAVEIKITGIATAKPPGLHAD